MNLQEGKWRVSWLKLRQNCVVSLLKGKLEGAELTSRLLRVARRIRRARLSGFVHKGCTEDFMGRR